MYFSFFPLLVSSSPTHSPTRWWRIVSLRIRTIYITIGVGRLKDNIIIIIVILASERIKEASGIAMTFVSSYYINPVFLLTIFFRVGIIVRAFPIYIHRLNLVLKSSRSKFSIAVSKFYRNYLNFYPNG